MSLKKKKQPPKYLYHHTSRFALEIIKEYGYLRLTPSNLLPPDASTAGYVYLKDINGNVYGEAYHDKNSDYKPVVWLTSEEYPNEIDLGLEQDTKSIDERVVPSKTEVTIVFPYSPRYISWREFANANNMDAAWRYRLERGRKANTWYICQTPIKLSDAVDIRIRVDLGDSHGDKH